MKDSNNMMKNLDDHLILSFSHVFLGEWGGGVINCDYISCFELDKLGQLFARIRVPCAYLPLSLSHY